MTAPPADTNIAKNEEQPAKREQEKAVPTPNAPETKQTKGLERTCKAGAGRRSAK